MKNILFFVFAFSCASFTYAQVPGETSYGFRLGANYSSLSGDDFNEDPNSRFGLHVNFLAEIPLNDKFSLQPEIGVSALGINEEEIRLPNGDNVQFKTNWLQVGVLANINVTESFFVLVGPQVGVNVTERDNNDYYNYDFAAVVGLGYMFDESWGIDLRYGYGLSNIFDREVADVADANNRWFQLGVSYKL